MRFLERRGWVPGARTARSMMSNAVAAAAIAATALAAAAGCAALPSPAHAEENGLVNWTALFGEAGTGSIAGTNADGVNDVQPLGDGGSIAVGAFDGGKSENPAAKGKVDAALIRYDANGTATATTLVGGAKTDYFNSVIQTNDGGFLAVGKTQSDNGDLAELAREGDDGLVAKFDASGALEKVVTFGGSDKDELLNAQIAYDGSGYVVTGYSHSTDGDLANANVPGNRNAVIAKYDNDLQLQWVNTLSTSGRDQFALAVPTQEAVALDADGAEVPTTSGYLAVGTAGASDGDLDGIGLGGEDAVVAKFADDGTREWVRAFGGAGDDEGLGITRAPETSDPDQTTSITTIYNNGLVISGTTDSADGTFADGKQSGTADEPVKSAFLLKLDAFGAAEWADTLNASADVTGDRVLAAEGGYLLAGTVKATENGANDLDFTGTAAYGKKDLYVAHYADNGARLNLFTAGGNDDDTMRALNAGVEGNYYIAGTTRSTDQQFAGMQGKADGFLMSLDATALMAYAQEKYLVPVEAWKATTDEASMMAPMLYADAYVEKSGEQYTVTAYFTEAQIMGQTVSPTILGAVSYERDGKLVRANPDEYDPSTHVKSCTMVVKTLDEPLYLHIEDAMGDIRLHFSLDQKRPTDTPPYFEPIRVTAPDFENTWKATLGGTDDEYAADMPCWRTGTR